MQKQRQAGSILRVLLLLLALVILLDIDSQRDLQASTAYAQQLQQLWLPALDAPQAGHLLIAAAHIDSALIGEGDEAILLWNAGSTPVELGGWRLEANGRRTTFPATGAPVLS